MPYTHEQLLLIDKPADVVWEWMSDARRLLNAYELDKAVYEVIYEVLEDVQSALIGMLEPEFEEVVTGDAEVREVFSVPRVGRVAGCYVRNGIITRGSKVRFLRDGVVIWNGAISSLKPVAGVTSTLLARVVVAPASGLVKVSTATPVPVAIRKARCHPGRPPKSPFAAAAGSCQAVIARIARPAR